MTEKEIQEVCCIVALLEEATERINALIGAANARNAVAEYRRSLFTFVQAEKSMSPGEASTDPIPQGKNNDDVNEKVISEKSLIEEIKEMLIEIQISGSLRIRKNGLFPENRR